MSIDFPGPFATRSATWSTTRKAISLALLAGSLSCLAQPAPRILATIDVDPQPEQIAGTLPRNIKYTLTSRDTSRSRTGNVVVSLGGVVVSTSPVTLMAKQSIIGITTVSSPTVGTHSLQIRFVSDTLCTKHLHTLPKKGGGTRQFTTCDPTVLAEGVRDVEFAPRLITTRISGSRFLELSHGEPNDGRNVRNGGMCVIHYVTCGSNPFAVGHDGVDVMFGASAPLPPGAQIQEAFFQPYWPQGLSAVDRGGLGSSGSYGAARAATPPPPAVAVHWENACQGSYARLPIVYEVSFVVRATEGTDLGEDGLDPSLVRVPACTPAEIATVQPAPSAEASGYHELIFLKATAPDPNFGGPIPFVADYGITSQGKVVSVQNAEDFRIGLVLPGKTITDCLSDHPSNAITLEAKGFTYDVASLFGPDPKFPIHLVACSTMSVTRQAIGVVISYTP